MAILLQEIEERAHRLTRGGNFARRVSKDLAAYTSPGAIVIPDEINESEMSAAFVICARTTDREGDVVEPQGCREYLDEYRANPIVLFDHNHQGAWAPIGMSEDKAKRFSLRIFDDRITARCYFHGLPFKGVNLSEEIFHLVVKGALRGASVGFLPLEAESIGYGREAGKHYHRWRMTEWSITPLQSNQDCLRACLDRGEIKTKSLVDSLSRYLPPAPVWANGVTLEVPMARPTVAAVRLEKSLFPKREDAAKWLSNHGRDSSSCKDLGAAWLFAQTTDELGGGKQSLAKGVTALHAIKKALPDDEDDEDETIADKQVTKGEDEDKPKEDVPPEKAPPEDGDEDEGAEEGDEEDAADPAKENADHSQKTGAKDLALLSEHFDALMAALPEILGRNDHPGVVNAMKRIAAKATELHTLISAVAKKAYPGLDLDSLKTAAQGGDEMVDDPAMADASPADDGTGTGTGVDVGSEMQADPDIDDDEDDQFKSLAAAVGKLDKVMQGW